MPSHLRRHNKPNQIHFVTFSCFRRLQFFRHDKVKLTFIGAMKRVRDRFKIRWIGYVIMPKRVHLLVAPTIYYVAFSLCAAGSPIETEC